jgi:NADH dehydrogenase [ubiquinone] 1 alpha subcomplex assembly factor 1
MNLFLILWSLWNFSNDADLKLNFGANKVQSWSVINDGVMGGMSQGTAKYNDNSVTFLGTIRLENNGGFSSLKSPFSAKDLSPFKNVEIRYRSKGIPMAFTLENSRAWYNTYYRMGLPSTDGAWDVVTLRLKKFQGQRVGQTTGNTMGADFASEVIRMGFINDAKGPGDFEFELDYIHFK